MEKRLEQCIDPEEENKTFIFPFYSFYSYFLILEVFV